MRFKFTDMHLTVDHGALFDLNVDAVKKGLRVAGDFYSTLIKTPRRKRCA
jgi:hypothetical protein